MSECIFLNGCPFFNAKETAKLENLIHYLKSRYCRNDFSVCARYRIATTIGREYVPLLMMPDQIQWAERILNAHRPEPAARV